MDFGFAAPAYARRASADKSPRPGMTKDYLPQFHAGPMGVQLLAWVDLYLDGAAPPPTVEQLLGQPDKAAE